ncbi:HIT family protein [Spiroplasma phoeniceum]|uniref:Histidine triad protein n=1 Tax=Spiroplasma phoeniceum P40 TaxID=1276259 RepID=A0A345DSB1_9MOLU|nr:HIT family protein [Spiroplasma phoeniceum]AXF97102.1 histidine triad protein [Spiroplasma phoeniceum P40]
MNENNCIFCEIIAQKIPSKKIYENNLVYAFLDAFPNSDGHTLVIPKKHFEYYSVTDDEYLTEVAKIGKIIAQKMYQTLKPVGINYVSNEKNEAFQKVFHYHLHIIPKYQKDEGYNFKINVDKEKLRDLAEIQQMLILK